MNQATLKSLMEASPHSFNDNVEHRILLYEILVELQRAEKFFDIFEDIEPKLCALLHSERVIVYKRGRHKRELSSHILVTGKWKEVRLDFSPSSIAGYVAMSQKPICLPDAMDKAALLAIHPNLANNAMADRSACIETRATMAVPILHGEILIGVLQLVNSTAGDYSPVEYQKLNMIAAMLGDHFHQELGVTDSPFDLLVKKGLISKSKLSEISQHAESIGRSVAYVLKNEVKIRRDDIGESLASFYQIPFAHKDLNPSVPSKLISHINPEYIRNQGWVPIAENGREVTILIDDPADSEKIMVIEQLFRGRTVKMMLMLTEEISDIAHAALRSDTDLDQSIQQLTALASGEVDDVPDAHIEEDRHDSNVIRLLNRLVTDAHTNGASDIHIQPTADNKSATVLYRVDGVCRTATRIPNKLIKPVISRLKVMCGMDLAERRLPQDGKCRIRCQGQTLEVRVAVIPNTHGLETAVIRLLANCEAMHIYGLNLSERNLSQVKRLAESAHGLFLVVGPTGSGKTTTLHSILGHINSGERIIWTVEDPVEITQAGLQQVNVNRKAGLTFATALRAFMRADPDVMLVGEMRDQETAETAIQAAMTGHMVFSTLHTNSAAETINRLVSMGIESYDIADALIGILSQRLARTTCSHCSEAQAVSEDDYAYLVRIVEQEGLPKLPAASEITTQHGPGCEACGDTGYLGRMGIHELLIVDQAITEMIATRCSSRQIIDYARQHGMQSMTSDAMSKFLSRHLDLRELKRLLP